MVSRLKKWFVGVVAVVLVVMTAALFFANIGKPAARAIFGMAGGLIFWWVFVGGFLMYRFRERVRVFVLGLPGGWRTKFVVFATLLALAEEAIAVCMTNMAPVFGVRVGEAYITASANYVDVVTLHSVVVFVPMFFGFAVLLGRYNFSPFSIFVLFGVMGTVSEALFAGNPGVLVQFYQWMFIYGLMMYLPAYCVPQDRGARPVRWWHYVIAAPFAFVIALPFIAVIAFVINGVLHHPSIHFPPIRL
ncbi:MAG: hypothetical protein HZB26_13235 [Candidatus Hydrogenedentes bacterium]|nr:hypothetical protein [Candidatus Hydrogenedentota bacterium]